MNALISSRLSERKELAQGGADSDFIGAGDLSANGIAD
jgi:hypothetical protein